MSNAFENYAEAAKPAWKQRQEQSANKRAETRRQSALEKQRDETDTLLKMARQQDREHLDALLAGPHGKDVRGLQSFLRTMTLSSAPALVRLVLDARWLLGLTNADRFLISTLIGHAIKRVRLKAELPASDESIPFGEPPEPPTAAEIIREHIDQLRHNPEACR